MWVVCVNFHPSGARHDLCAPLRVHDACECTFGCVNFFFSHRTLRFAPRLVNTTLRVGCTLRVHVRTPAVCYHHLRWVRFAPKNHFSFGILTLRVNIPLGCTSRARAKPPCRIGSHKIFAANGLYLKIKCGSGRSPDHTFRQKCDPNQHFASKMKKMSLIFIFEPKYFFLNPKNRRNSSFFRYFSFSFSN